MLNIKLFNLRKSKVNYLEVPYTLNSKFSTQFEMGKFSIFINNFSIFFLYIIVSCKWCTFSISNWICFHGRFYTLTPKHFLSKIIRIHTVPTCVSLSGLFARLPLFSINMSLYEPSRIPNLDSTAFHYSKCVELMS